MFPLLRAETNGFLFADAPRYAPPRPMPKRPPSVHHGLAVTLASVSELEADAAAWRGLAEHMLEPSIFATPDIALPALHHLPEGRTAFALTVHETAPGGERILRGLIPMTTTRFALSAGEARVWRSPFSPAPIILLDRQRAAQAAAAALAFLEAEGRRAAVLTVPGLSPAGPLAGALREAALRTGRNVEWVNESEAAPGRLGFDAADFAALASCLDADRAVSSSAIWRTSSARDVRDALERFLVVEAREARAEGRRSLIEAPGAASFLRTATRQLARLRRCRLAILEGIEGPAAAAILAGSGTAPVLWRIAGEGAARHQLAAALVRTLPSKSTQVVISDPRLVEDLREAGFDEGLGLRADLRVLTRRGKRAAPVSLRVREKIGRRLRALSAGPRFARA